MIQITDKKNCSGCGACFQACPKKCIQMQVDDEGFLYPKVLAKACIDCGLCERICPVINNTDTERQPVAYAAYNKNEEIRLSSSSGGIFTLLAEHILEAGGVVFGTILSADCREAYITYAEDMNLLEPMRGSKYLKNNVKDSYIKAKEFLTTGRKVLFTGTPCEIEGLKAFLGKEYNNLYTQDIICHGSSSPKVWGKYLDYLERKFQGKTRLTFFRHKNYGWKRFAVSLLFNNDIAYLATLDKDIYMQFFLQNLCLRPSCYACSFKKLNKSSDITLADFWGCNNVCPELDDDKGLSAVLVHSEKGRELFEAIYKDIIYKEVQANDVIKYNPSMVTSCVEPPNRNLFMQDLDKLSILELAKKHIKQPSLLSRIKRSIPQPVKDFIKHCIGRR